jgi:cathepsin B
MVEELYTNGPITVAYTVFDDFLTYKSGIYVKSPGAKALGGHSVKIVGYGVTKATNTTAGGIKYWSVANSWNSEWGANGFFKILRGVDECYIESSAVVAGIPMFN